MSDSTSSKRAETIFDYDGNPLPAGTRGLFAHIWRRTDNYGHADITVRGKTLRGIIRQIPRGAKFTVHATLFDGSEIRVRMTA